jgi:hypothetical protein
MSLWRRGTRMKKKGVENKRVISEKVVEMMKTMRLRSRGRKMLENLYWSEKK